MVPELVISAALGILVFGGLAFHDAVAERLATIDRDPELTDLEDLD